MTHPNGSSKNGNGSEERGPAGAAAAKPAPSRRGGLGRGLSALIPQSATEPRPARQTPPNDPVQSVEPISTSAVVSVPGGEKLRAIPLRSISLNPQQPRKEFKREELDDLTASIQEHGILQPIAVRLKEGSGDTASYELIAGERRFRAASAAGLADVPALIKEDVSDRESLALAIIENIQREDLNVIEAAQGYDELLHAYNMTQTELAQSIGKSQPQIANTLRMLNLPAPIQDSLRSSTISEGHAKVILSLKTEPEQITLWNEVVGQGLTVRSAEKRAAALRAAKPTPTRPAQTRTPAGGDQHLAEIGERISLSLGTKVRLVAGKEQRGVIEVSYFDHEQLEDLLDKLGAGG